MLKSEVFLAGMQAKNYTRSTWVISLLAVCYEPDDAWRKDPFPYRIVRTKDGVYCVDPTGTELIRITDAPDNGPLIHYKERIDITPDTVPNARGPINTIYGNVLLNYILLIHVFGTRIEFMTGKIGGARILKILEKECEADPEDGVRTPGKIYISDYVAFTDSYYFLDNFTKVAIPGDTERSLTTHPDVPKLKAELLEKYKDQLDDPAIQTLISDALIALDKEWIAGDSSSGVISSAKDFGVIRKKLFLMVGGEPGFSDSNRIEPIVNSYSEGWDLEKFPMYMDALRAGSYDRGFQTSLGGEEVKWLQRASGTTDVTIDDCGTTLGMRTPITEENKHKFVGFHYIGPKGEPVLYEEANIGAYLGKTLAMRSAMFCKAQDSDRCKICVGPRLASLPNAISSAISGIGDEIMLIFMGSMHGKAAVTAKYDIDVHLT